MTIKYNIGPAESQKLKAVMVKSTRGLNAGLLDEKRNLIIGFYPNAPYYPAGNTKAALQVQKHKLVSNVEVFGFPCSHLRGNTYKLL